MAEVRRVQLTTFPCDFPSSPPGEKSTLHTNSAPCSAPSPVGHSEAAGKSSEVAQSQTTVRCVLTLFKSDDHVFPEFSYTELVDERKRGSFAIKDGAQNKSNEQEDHLDGELYDIARHFENKYAEVKKRKKDRVQDLVDIGYGYDDEDSFIDNSEAYDELVPASLTTKHGGFYVNCGVLQFRQASDTELEDFTPRRVSPKPTKKRKLMEGSDKPRKRRSGEGGVLKQPVDPVSTAGSLSERGVEEPKKMKKKTSAGPLSVTNMLKKFRRQKEREVQRQAGKVGTPRFPMCRTDAGGHGGTGLADPLLSLISSTNDHALIQAAVMVDFDIDLETLLDATEDVSQIKMVPCASAIYPVMESPAGEGVQNQSTVLCKDERKTELKSSLVPQPGTPPEGGFSQKPERTAGDLQVDPFEKLREAIDQVMPGQIARFHDNCQAHAQVKSTKGADEKRSRDQRVNVDEEEGEGEEKFGKRGPQKKFRWTEEIRDCLCLVVKAKMDRYETDKTENQEKDAYLKNFLDAKIKTLWPKGWMQPWLLLRESKKLLAHSSSAQKKAERSPPSANSGSTAADGTAGSPEDHLRGASSPDESALPSDIDKKTLKEVLATSAHPNVSGLVGGKGVDRLGSETPTLSEMMEPPAPGRPAPAPSAPSAPSRSPLDLLATQALARGSLAKTTISQKLKAAATSSARGKSWDHSGPPVPPSAPQSTPVRFPGASTGHPLEAAVAHGAQVPGEAEATKTQAVPGDGTSMPLREECQQVALSE